MMVLVAQRGVAGNIFETVNAIFSRLDVLAHPRNLVGVVEQMSIVWAVVFLIAGLVCLLNGFKLYKWVTVVLALCIGVFAGYAMGKRIDAEYIVAACLGGLLAVGAWPLIKYAVAILGGLVGAFVGANAWAACADLAGPAHRATIAQTYWVGALVGLIVFGMLAFILFKLTVMFFTSISGATVALIGALGLVLQVPQWRAEITAWSTNASAVVFPMLVLVPALIGLILQQAKPGGAAAEGKPAGGGGSGK